MTTERHVSHSALSTWQKCGTRYDLTYNRQIEEVPSVWNVGGHALHRTTEQIDRQYLEDRTANNNGPLFADLFYEELAQAEESSGLSSDQFAVAAKGKPGSPQGENIDWWLERGPLWVDNWVQRRNTTKNRIWHTPDGPAIELPISLTLPSGVEVKMVIDRIEVNENNVLEIVDVKSGRRKPDSDLQLAVYKYGISRTLDAEAGVGSYWMARTGETIVHDRISRVAPDAVESMFEAFVRARRAGIYIPAPTTMCRACPVRRLCPVY